MKNVSIAGKLAGRLDKTERRTLKRPENWNYQLKNMVSRLGFIGDRYVYGLASFEPKTVGMNGSCGDIIRWKDPSDPEHKLRQYMMLLDQIRPGLFVSLHVQSLPPIDGLHFV